MTKRPEQHQIEDLSRLKFGIRIPQGWVFRDKPQDYGIDGEVEVFDEKGHATGEVFLVQLKATASDKNHTIRNVQMRIETLSYFRKLAFPVIFS